MASKFPVVMETMMKYCWGSLFIGTPCTSLVQRDNKSSFKIINHLT